MIDVFGHLFDPQAWGGSSGVGALLARHVIVTVLVVAAAWLVALPLGPVVGRALRRWPVLGVPVLGWIAFVALLGGGRAWAGVVAAMLLCVPTLLRGLGEVADLDDGLARTARSLGLRRAWMAGRVGAETHVAATGRALLVGNVAVALAAVTGVDGLGTLLLTALHPGGYSQAVAAVTLLSGLALLFAALCGALAALLRRRRGHQAPLERVEVPV